MFYLYQDESLRSQHNGVRNNVGWYDFTHRVVEVSGPDAMAFLNKMYVANLEKQGVGKAKYTTMLDEDGWICDDVIIFRLAEDKYWVSTLYMKDLLMRYGWYADAFDVEYRDITEEWRMYSVQGPKSTELVNLVINDPVDDLKFFNIRDTGLGDIPMKVARSGYTGEKFGYELYIPIEHAAELEAKLTAEGDKLGATHVTEIDVMAMTLPAEAGFYLMLDLRRLTPFEAGFDGTIDWKKDFVGKKAARKLRRVEPRRKLVGIEIPDYDAVIYGGPHGAVVEKDGKPVGRVTKFTYGYTVEKNIGYAIIDTPYTELGTKLSANGYEIIVTDKNRLNT